MDNKQSNTAFYKESVEYSKFDGMEFLKPFSGNSYDLVVKPGEHKFVIIRVKVAGYSSSYSTSS